MKILNKKKICMLIVTILMILISINILTNVCQATEEMTVLEFVKKQYPDFFNKGKKDDDAYYDFLVAVAYENLSGSKSEYYDFAHNNMVIPIRDSALKRI